MSRLYPDTHPKVAALLLEMMRNVPPARRLRMMAEMNAAVKTLALSGLKSRYPDDPPEMIQRRLADLFLGPGLARNIYSSVHSGRNLMLSEPIYVLLEVVRAFCQIDIPYLVGGSLASDVYGSVRATRDVDIVADIHADQVSKLAGLLKGTFYADEEMIHEAVAHGSSFNLVHLETMFKVDIFLLKQRPFDQNQMKRRVLQSISENPEEKIYFSTAEDIILAKLEWYQQGGRVSDQQWRDILGILASQAGRIDEGYLRTWANNLGLRDLLETAMEDAGG